MPISTNEQIWDSLAGVCASIKNPRKRSYMIRKCWEWFRIHKSQYADYSILKEAVKKKIKGD